MTEPVRDAAAFPADPRVLAAMLPAYLGRYQDLPSTGRQDADRAFGDAVAAIQPFEWAELATAYQAAGSHYGPWDAAAAARRLAGAFMAPLIAADSRVEGIGALDALVARSGAGARVVLVGNHLSYIDTTATWALLHLHGRGPVADRLCAVAGPKVYEDPFRRLAAVALHTLKVPQSAALAHNEAGLSPREVGRLAVESVRQARAVMDAGRILVLYPEGARSRTGRLGPFLPATARYLDGAVVLPMAIEGTDRMQPIGDERSRPATLRLAFGEPLDAAAIAAGGATRDDVMERVRGGVARLIPRECVEGEVG